MNGRQVSTAVLFILRRTRNGDDSLARKSKHHDGGSVCTSEADT
jgi:hypothetical protein